MREDPAHNAGELLERAQSDAGLHGELDALPPEQQQVVRAAYLEPRTMAQIASDRSIPMGTVKSRLRRALARLRVSLSHGRSS